MTTPAFNFISGLCRRSCVAAVVVAFAVAALLGSRLTAAEHAEHAKAETKAVQKAEAGHEGHDHGAGGCQGCCGDEPSELKKFGYAYLTAYMFCLSFCLGALFLVILNHLFDAQWMLPIRRFLEHLACQLFPTMAILWIPIGILAPKLYPWMTSDPATDHALAAKYPLFTINFFYGISLLIFLVWWFISSGLRRASLAQDKDGAAQHTRTMRKYAAGGIFCFAFSLTGAAIFWMKALSHQFFSTMYGVVYFAGSVWVTVITTYWLLLYFRNRGELKDVTREVTFHDCGKLFFAFTVFYAYIHFSQYFLIWNAAVPEETFWYVAREKGSWWWVGQLTIFGHFWMPFLMLLPIHRKLNLGFMSTMAGWAWVCHYLDLQFNIGPVLYPDGPHLGIYDVLCLSGLLAVIIFRFTSAFNAHPPYPQRDPRVAESMGVYVEPAASKAAH
ncbi:MAG: hypothetical protein EBS84_17630 [Proteobacteria bacterium]|nr:hypothetical protein [Verrucomicrobiota bacterium]NBU10816.1 hypothetical protein [Pseudomonadota bacterium]